MSQQAPEKKAPQKPSFLKNIGLAGTAAVITVNMIHPIDVIKTRLQIQGEAGRATKQYNGVSGVIRTIATEEGAAAFYKGNIHDVIQLVFNRVYFIQVLEQL